MSVMNNKKPGGREKVLSIISSARGRPVPSWDVQKVHTPLGWLGTSGDRKARELAAEGIISVEYILVEGPDGKRRRYAHYSFPESQQLELFDSLPGNQDVVGYPTQYGSYNV